jgi:hypothetical protein
VASCFYGIVRDAFLEHLIRKVRKSKEADGRPECWSI